MTALIIDDPALEREALQNLLTQYCPSVEVLGTADNAEKGAQLARELQPDLLFLDLDVSGKKGIDILENSPSHMGGVVLTSDPQKVKKTEVRRKTFNYLPKPVNPADFLYVVSRTIEKIDEQKSKVQRELKPPVKSLSRLLLPTINGFNVVKIKDIVRLEAEKNYTFFYFTNGHKMLVSKTLKEFAQCLEKSNFMRIHQSHLINLKHVLRYNKGRGGYVTMIDDSVVDVARSHREEFIQVMNRFRC